MLYTPRGATPYRPLRGGRNRRGGRRGAPQRSGLIRLLNRTDDGVEHHFALKVPATDDLGLKYQARIQPHGGVMMRQTNAPPSFFGAVGAPEGDEQIHIVPSS
jgi:hypothetical protein